MAGASPSTRSTSQSTQNTHTPPGATYPSPNTPRSSAASRVSDFAGLQMADLPSEGRPALRIPRSTVRNPVSGTSSSRHTGRVPVLGGAARSLRGGRTRARTTEYAIAPLQPGTSRDHRKATGATESDGSDDTHWSRRDKSVCIWDHFRERRTQRSHLWLRAEIPEVHTARLHVDGEVSTADS